MWRDFPLPDGSYSDPTRPWSQQDLVNYIPTFAEQPGTRTRARYTPAPGLQTFASVGDGPIRGMRDVEGTLFVVSGNHLYRVTKAGVATSLGTIPGSGLVCMTHNQITDGNQVVVGNGLSGYLYNTVTETFTQITDDAFPGLISCDFLGQYVLGIEPQRRFWFHSDLADAASYSDLNRYEAESAPDRIVGLIASHNEVLIFGERTIEPWVNEPTENAAFQRNSSAVIEKGCASGQTICRLDNSVYFLGNDKIVYRLEGYTPVPVSTKPMVAAFRDLDASRAFAFTFEDSGHVIYYLTFPDGQTWGFDASTQKWHRRESFTLDRWRLNCLAKSGDAYIGGDFQSGKLYRLTWGFVYEGCEIMPRRMRSGVLHNNGNRVVVNGFKLLAHTGSAASQVESALPPSISGAAPDAQVGDAISYQYTITPAFPGQHVTLTVNGTLPPGLTLSGSGLLSGTLTTAGIYEFTVTPSSECAEGEPLHDMVTVSDTVISAILTDAPILYWVLHETSGTAITDFSGYNRHGTMTGGATLTGSGIVLDGSTGQGVYYPGNVAGSVLDVAGDNTWAIEAVVTRAGNGGSVYEWIAGQWRSPNFGYVNSLLALGGSTSRGQPLGAFSESGSPSTIRFVSGASALTNSVRTHLLVTRAADDKLYLYENGTLIATSTPYIGEVGVASNGAKFMVGSDADTANYYPTSYAFNGKIEHVAVYDQTITAARALYHAQVHGLA